jgi:putative ABC transport system permease protein
MSRSLKIAREVMASLRANRTRTALMALGVAVGVAVLSTVIILGQGTRRRVMALVEKHGLDMVMIRAGGEVQVFAPGADRGLQVLVEEDARAIAAELPHIEMVSPVQNQRGITVTHEDRSVVTRGFGVAASWMEIRRWGIAEGRFITDADMQSFARVAILGARVARQLFPEGSAVGRTIRVGGDPYSVEGVFVEMGVDAGGDDWDNRIVVPFTTSSRRLFGRPYLEQIILRVDVLRLPETAERIRALLRVRHQIGPGDPDDFFVREPEDVQDAALETSSTLSSLLWGVSLVALLAGGLVIMNLMLLSVSQRGPEIGLRRAVGARASDITRHFLLESTFIALAGGFAGTLVGLAVATGLSLAGVADSHVTWLPFGLAFAGCALIGLAFGIHPARKAAGLDPGRILREPRS